MNDAAMLADAQQTCAFLAALFGSICAGDPQHPLLAKAIAECIGSYAAWFGREQGAPLHTALQQLLHFMAVPQSAASAAAAFRNLCVRCGSRLASTAELVPLLQAVKAALARPGGFAWTLVACRFGIDSLYTACQYGAIPGQHVVWQISMVMF